MSKVLTSEEIAALLVAVGPGGGGDRAAVSGVPVVYDFRRPDRIAKEQLRSLHLLHDRFALNVSTSLSAFLRSMTEVVIVSVEQSAYSEFLMALPDPTAFYALSLEPLDLVGALELNPSVAFTMVDRMLGGSGEAEEPTRALTEIEQNVVDSVVKLLLDNLTEAWRPVTDVQFKIHGRETRPQMLQVLGPNEIVIVCSFEIRLAHARGMFNLCIPAAAIEVLGEAFAQGWHRTRREPTAEESARVAANLGRIPLDVTAQLDTSLTARELLALQPGDVLSLGHSAAQPVNVYVGSVPALVGRLTQQHGSMVIAIQSQAPATAEGAVA